MNFKKRVNGSWVDAPYYVHKTDTDTITTFPADIYANAATATVGLKGQTVQSGTPSPQNPVMPEGAGERTKNLYPLDINKLHVGRVETDGTIDYEVGTLSIDGDTITYTYNTPWRGFYTDFIPIGSATTLTMSPVPPNGTTSCACYDSNNNFLGRANATPMIIYRVFTLKEGTTKVRIAASSGDSVFSVTKPQLEVGNVATAYEPYGIKIPILSANTTTPVYLGEVQTTRKVKKYECTGQENWDVNPSSNVFFANIDGALGAVGVVTAICSHYNAVENKTLYNQVPNNSMCIRANASILWIKDTNYDSGSYYTAIEDFKAYLAAQYAAGTPVTVWHVLATPQTAVVNEPLQKIGTYADEIYNVSIPVTAGGDTLSVGTTVQPSEVTAAYHGWHNGAVKDYENGDWQPQVQALSLSNAPMLSNSLMAFPDMSEPEIEPETTE